MVPEPEDLVEDEGTVEEEIPEEAIEGGDTAAEELAEEPADDGAEAVEDAPAVEESAHS